NKIRIIIAYTDWLGKWRLSWSKSPCQRQNNGPGRTVVAVTGNGVIVLVEYVVHIQTGGEILIDFVACQQVDHHIRRLCKPLVLIRAQAVVIDLALPTHATAQGQAVYQAIQSVSGEQLCKAFGHTGINAYSFIVYRTVVGVAGGHLPAGGKHTGKLYLEAACLGARFRRIGLRTVWRECI